jgi:hypothetical protein
LTGVCEANSKVKTSKEAGFYLLHKHAKNDKIPKEAENATPKEEKN